jgi:hypothetical protein
VHKRDFARFQRIGAIDQVVRGHALEHDRGAVVERDRVGKLDEFRRGYGHVLGVAARVHRVRNAVARYEAGNARRDGTHRARAFHARNEGQVRRGVSAVAEVDVDEVDARGGELHQHLTGLEFGLGYAVFEAQNLGAAGLRDAYGFHETV